MSIQAVAWALEQDFSYKTGKGHVRSCHAAKLVLIALANHADHVSGHCWPSAETIAREASCAVASVYRMVAALARNGFIDVKKVRGPDGKQRSNNYWLLFDRKPAEWQFFAGDDGDENPENEPGDFQPHDTKSPGSEPKSDSESPGPSDVRVTRHIMPEPSSLEPSESEIVDSTRATPADSPATPPQPSPPIRPPRGFDPNNRQRELDRIRAADEARKAKLHPVIEGSEPWFAWLAYPNPDKGGKCHPATLTCTIKLPNGRLDRGWNFPTLWPPKREQTGPPEAAE